MNGEVGAVDVLAAHLANALERVDSLEAAALLTEQARVDSEGRLEAMAASFLDLCLKMQRQLDYVVGELCAAQDRIEWLDSHAVSKGAVAKIPVAKSPRIRQETRTLSQRDPGIAQRYDLVFSNIGRR